VKFVTWFSDVGKDDGNLVGGKGANLGELTRAGLPVPPGFIVTSEAYFSFLDGAGLRPALERNLSGLDVTNPGRLSEAASAIKQVISGAPMSGDLAADISAAYANAGAGVVAVRSSATAEDLADASFAGQQSTFLNVAGHNLLENVQACWASLFEPQAIAYRERRGIQHLDVGIAVVIQQMVQSDRSGVMFTMHPVTGDAGKIVIEAAYGLGEACVSGVVTPDFYVVDKPSLNIEEKTVAAQEQELVRGDSPDSAEDANRWIAVPPERGGRQKLSDEEIVGIAEIGKRIESHYGTPQDIEWAENSGVFYVVQARPVTTAG